MKWYAMVAGRRYPLDAYLLPTLDEWRVIGDYEGTPISRDASTITRATARWRAAAVQIEQQA